MQLQEQFYKSPNETPTENVRSDTFPEGTIGRGHFRDTGCDLAPACLSCPFPICEKYEGTPEPEKKRAERNAKILKLRKEKLTVREIAVRTGVSTRQINRVLANGAAS